MKTTEKKEIQRGINNLFGVISDLISKHNVQRSFAVVPKYCFHLDLIRIECSSNLTYKYIIIDELGLRVVENKDEPFDSSTEFNSFFEELKSFLEQKIKCFTNHFAYVETHKMAKTLNY